MAGPVNILLVGGGGREHALAQALARSPKLGTLHVTHPSNPGLAELGRPVNVPVSKRELYRLVGYCEKHAVGLAVIGPEDPLAEGYGDALRAAGVPVFGPNADGARIEADKAWAKQLMRSASIPTPEGRVFASASAALDYIESRTEPPVVKAAGLAKGKGVIVPATLGEAADAVRRIMLERAFGSAGDVVVLEERLKGPELSVLAITDGRAILVLPTCQDHKRLGDGDTGPNTGGMGAFSPAETADDAMMRRIETGVLLPVVDALKREGIDYRGVLYAGLMLTHGGPKVLEFNARFGDPECQPLMVRYTGDAVDLLLATAERRLDEVEPRWDPRPAVCVVLASEGYPDAPRRGVEITGIESARQLPDVHIHFAGVERDAAGVLRTAGGRVLSVTALGDTMAEARQRAYAACERIRFAGMVYRTDIATSHSSARAAVSSAS